MFGDPFGSPFGGAMFVQECSACGAAIINLTKHALYHESLAVLARQVVAPEASDEEWAEIQVQAAAYSVLREEEMRVEAESKLTPEERARMELMRRIFGMGSDQE